ncbi:MAG: hypothetical protein MSG78_02595 [Clostridiales bacterium]|nr:hypothetical protein [Clostridiales bacterium]
MVNLTKEEKKQAVIDLCLRDTSASDIAAKYRVDRVSLYSWKRELLNKKDVQPMPKRKKMPSVELLQEKVRDLNEQAEKLRKEVYKLQLEKDVLEKASEIIKKEQGVTLKTLTNREKAIVIDTLRNKYSLKELLSVFQMAKGSYFYQAKVRNAPDKYKEIRTLITKFFKELKETYGYRRIYLDLKVLCYNKVVTGVANKI